MRMIIIIEFIPTWEVFAFIQRKRSSGLVVVALECQCVRGFIEHGIRLCWGFICEVAIGVVRHFLAFLVLVVGYGTNKISATCKHTTVKLTCCCHELVVCIDGGESRIEAEHPTHIRHVLSVEVWYIECCECLTATEHVTHVRHVLCIEIWNVECCKSMTATEHVTHVRHVLSIEIWDIECCEYKTPMEHVAHVRHVLSIEFWNIKCCECRTAIEHPTHVRYVLCVQIFNAFYIR